MEKERTKDGKQTPTFIIETARDMFMQQGYRAVSTRQIADACGITQPALYHHFRGKKEIYTEVIRTVLAETETELKKIVTAHQSIEVIMQQLFTYFLTYHQYDISMMFHDVVHEFDDVTRQNIQTWWNKSFLEPVVLLIETAVDRGEMKDFREMGTNQIEVAFMILTIIKSAIDPISMKHVPPELLASETQRRSKLFVGMILSGLGTSPTTL